MANKQMRWWLAAPIFALVFFHASVSSAVPCLTGTTPTTGAKGFKTPVHRSCDWDTAAVNPNWDILNGDGYAVPTYNPKNPVYGAFGDDSHDDTTAIQNAASACESAGGGIIHVPRGTYLISQVTIGSSCTLLGAGIDATIFHCKSTEANACLHASASGKLATNASNYGNSVSNVGFSGFTLNVNGTARIAGSLGGYVRGLVVAHNSSDIFIRNIRVTDGGSRGIEVNPSHHVWVTDNLCEDSSHTVEAEGDCIHVGNPCNNGIREPPSWCDTTAKINTCYDIHINRNTVIRTGDTAISGQYCSDEEIANNTYLGDEYFSCTVNSDCGPSGTCSGGSICTPTTDESGLDLFGASRVRVESNEFNQVRNACVISQAFTDPFGHTWAPTEITINNLVCKKNTVTVTNGAAVFFSGSSGAPAYGMIVSNSTFRDTPVEAINYNTQILGGAITGNTGTNIGFNESGTGDQSAINLGATGGSPVSGITVTGNRLECTSGTHCKYGIEQLYSSASGLLIANNSIVNVSQALVRSVGGATVLQTGNGITYAIISGGSNLLDNAGNGSQVYCSDCTATDPCGSGGTGAIAYKIDGAWSCNQRNPSLNVKTFGAKGDGSTSDTTAFTNSITAANTAGGGTIKVPQGTYPICNVFMRPNVTIQCEPGATLTFATGCSTSNPLFTPHTTASYMTTNFKIRGCKFTRNTGIASTNYFSLSGLSLQNTVIEDNEFDLSGGRPTSVIGGGGTAKWTFRHNLFYGDCDYKTHTNGVMTSSRSFNHLIFDGNTVECLYNGIVLDSQDSTGTGNDFLIENNTFDQMWQYGKAFLTNAGNTGSTTYSSTVITDTSGIDLSTTAYRDIVRVLPVRITGTVTQAGVSWPGELVDSAANFATAGSGAGFATTGVKRGDLIRTATAWATVLYDAHDNSTCTASVTPADCCTGSGTGTCEQRLFVSEWRDLTTYRPTTAPQATTAYTIYELVLGDATSDTTTTVTATTNYPGFHDRFGNAVTSISAGTLYEIVGHPNYHIQGEHGFSNIVVRNNHLMRGWGDQIGLNQVHRAVVTGNVVEEGMDTGITVTPDGGGSIVSNNYIHDQGITGIAVVGTNAVVENNWLINNRWLQDAPTPNSTLKGQACITVPGSQTAGMRIAHNLCTYDSEFVLPASTGTSAISLTQGATDITLDHNTINPAYGGGAVHLGSVSNIRWEENGALGTNIQGQCTCSVNADCGTSGFCSFGVCLESASNPARYNCTADADCAATFHCSLGDIMLDGGMISVAFADLGNYANGSRGFCSDCAATTPCAGSGTGAWAYRLNGAWSCNSGIPTYGYPTFEANASPLSTTTTEYFAVSGSLLTPNATETNVDIPVPNAMHVYAIACGLDTAPTGATKTRTFDLRKNATTNILSCTMTDTAKTCKATSSGVALAAGDKVDWRSTMANTPSASDVTCIFHYAIDAF